MPAPRLKYQEPADWSRSSVESAIAADKPEDLWRAVIAVSMHEENLNAVIWLSETHPSSGHTVVLEDDGRSC